VHLSAIQFCHLGGGSRGIERIELVGREAHAALLGLHRSADLRMGYCHDSDNSATGDRDVCRLDIERVVVRPSGRDPHIGFEIDPVERRLHLKRIRAGRAIDEKIRIWGNLADDLSINLDSTLISKVAVRSMALRGLMK
jgi:hypothetical protein